MGVPFFTRGASAQSGGTIDAGATITVRTNEQINATGKNLPPRAIDISRKKSIKRRTEIISNAAAVSADTSIDVMAQETCA